MRVSHSLVFFAAGFACAVALTGRTARTEPVSAGAGGCTASRCQGSATPSCACALGPTGREPAASVMKP